MYIRLGRLAVPDVYTPETCNFKIGKGDVIVNGTDVTIVATGLMVAEAIKASELLKEEGISAAVINISTIKPIDSKLLAEYAAKTGCIVTAEEHNIYGGLGSAVCESLCDTEPMPVPVVRVGINDVFGTSGKAKEVLDYFGLNAANLVQKAKEAISRKNS